MGDHGSGQALCDGKGLGMEITEHGVGAPTTNEFDSVGVDASAEQCHGAVGAKAAGREFMGRKAEIWRGLGCGAENFGDIGSGNMKPAGLAPVGAQEGLARGLDTAHEGFCGTRNNVSTEAMGNSLALVLVFFGWGT
mmetsp:Transcript_10441/g.23050  ORF Transcript_10441/g.23050 Transcript_10441/m.23050 type:complete len:137 (-) Transcript_10441:303-713(-)